MELGIGAHADVDYCDGHLKVDVGAAFIFGASVQIDLNVGGACEAVKDAACYVGEKVADGAKAAWNWVCDLF